MNVKARFTRMEERTDILSLQSMMPALCSVEMHSSVKFFLRVYKRGKLGLLC